MWSYISKIFLSGIAVIIPLFITYTVFEWVFLGLEDFSKQVILSVLPPKYYFTGLGALCAVAIIFTIGILNRTYLTRFIIKGIEYVFSHTPIISRIYKPLKDISNIMDGDIKDKIGNPVLVNLTGSDTSILGFVTKEDIEIIAESENHDQKVAVYIQMSYQIGGFTFLVPKSQLKSVDMSVEDAVQWSLSAGVSQGNKQKVNNCVFNSK